MSREGRQSGATAVEVAVQNPNRYPEGRAVRWRGWLVHLVSELAPDAAGFGVRFASDRELRRFNRELRGKDYPTDVLSFPGDETVEGRYLGDVLISVPVARRQATERGHSVDRELQILLLHGVLHCLGHDHETDDGAMERLERKLARRFVGERELSP